MDEYLDLTWGLMGLIKDGAAHISILVFLVVLTCFLVLEFFSHFRLASASLKQLVGIIFKWIPVDFTYSASKLMFEL